MKKIFLLAIGVLCCMYSAAQTHIPEGIDKNVQDYVICEYVKAYCESICNKKGNETRTDVRNYKNKIEAKLRDNKIDNPVSHDYLIELLNPKWSKTKTDIVDELLNNKLETVEDILDIKNLKKEYKLKIAYKTDTLKTELIDYINKISGPPDDGCEGLKKENESLKKENESLKNTIKNGNGKGTNNKWLIMAFIVGLVFGIIIMYYISPNVNKILHKDDDDPQDDNNGKYGNYKSNKEMNLESEKLDEKIKKLNNKIESLNNKIASLEKEKDSLGEDNQLKDKQIMKLTDTIQELKRKIDNGGGTDALPPSEPSKYLKTATKGVFNKSFDTNDGCYFKMFHIVGDKAQFEFLGNEAYCIANKDAIFDYVCDIYGIFEAKHIKNVMPGELQNIGDDQWKVVTKAKINFEA